MKVKMLTLDAGPDGVKEPGKVYTVDAKEGKALINGGFAELVEADQPTKPAAPDVPEGLIAHNGGWYELPNGEKVQGLEKAVQALDDFRAAEQKAAEDAEALRLQEEAAKKAAENQQSNDDK